MKHIDIIKGLDTLDYQTKGLDQGAEIRGRATELMRLFNEKQKSDISSLSIGKICKIQLVDVQNLRNSRPAEVTEGSHKTTLYLVTESPTDVSVEHPPPHVTVIKLAIT